MLGTIYKRVAIDNIKRKKIKVEVMPQYARETDASTKSIVRCNCESHSFVRC